MLIHPLATSTMEESTSLDEHITGEQLVTIILWRGKIFHDPAVHLHKNRSAQVMC